MTNATLRRERGEGKLSGILSLIFIAAFVYALLNVGPPYLADYNLKDNMIQIARLGRGANPDDAIKEKLMRIVRDEGLESYIFPSDFKISTHETSRRIAVEYKRTMQVLPGFKWTKTFSHEVDEPFF